MSRELLSSKVVVLEEAPVVRGIPSASTSIVGAVGTAERGPVGEPVLTTTFAEFERVFGEFSPEATLPLAALGFFENGGSALWAVRTVHYGDISEPASATAARAAGFATVSGGPAVPATPDPGDAADPGDDTGSPENGEPEEATDRVVRFEGRDPGAYANRVEVKVSAPRSGDAGLFDLAVIEDGVYRESFPNLSLDSSHERFLEAIMNAPRGGSTLIRAFRVHEADSLALTPQKVALTGGDDGLSGLEDMDFVGLSTAKTGLHALDRVPDISLLIVPGRASPAVHGAMVRYCEVDRDGLLFAVLDPPRGESATGIVTYVERTAGLLGLTEHAAIYWPWLKVTNPARSVFGRADSLVVPPSGIICGVFGRTDSSRVGGVYDPPAGIEQGRMLGVVGFETDEVLEERRRDLIYPKRINPLTTGPGLPRFIDGSRTLKGDGNFPYVAERRGVIFIERSLKAGLEFARHRNNTEDLRAQVRRTITAFLMMQMRAGAFRSQEPEKAFFVDLTGNTTEEIFAGRLVVRVGLATNKPAEFVIVRISQAVLPGSGE